MLKSIVWKRLQDHPILSTITGHFHITPLMNTSKSILRLGNWGELLPAGMWQSEISLRLGCKPALTPKPILEANAPRYLGTEKRFHLISWLLRTLVLRDHFG